MGAGDPIRQRREAWLALSDSAHDAQADSAQESGPASAQLNGPIVHAHGRQRVGGVEGQALAALSTTTGPEAALVAGGGDVGRGYLEEDSRRLGGRSSFIRVGQFI